ncbi:hypothetical protein sscle_13g092720 [Sclerotinia sclerotiorum 1980 UF-70]|uniref:C2H2-type domain-containing protein n=2 Tax=Sclerotinia sclerotiorum (strain ATCC 18683 / 1980 / Ss-1) TaxID=665079 RepID=A0A1D9QI81_SCLS1|nr:hypothetical protein sscle_13g092720 [Sclerotinia sclerotiorum 1980 UF-70]
MATSLDATTCTECSKTFHGARLLDSHIRTVHKDEEECSICRSVVKGLVQHKRRVHREISRTTKRPSNCQHCGNSFVKIGRHRCKKEIKKSPIQPILPAPAPADANIKSSQSSSSMDCLTDVPLPAFYPLPHFFDDRAISPFFLCSAAQIRQLPLYDPWVESDSASQMPSQECYAEMDIMSSAINQTIPFDPTSVFSEIASGYPYRLSSTLSLPLNPISYDQDTGTASATGAISSTAIPDYNVPIPTIEPPDADYPVVEEFDMFDSGVNAMEFEDLIDWGDFWEHEISEFL